MNIVNVIRQYRKWRGNWDELCDRCGLCCYTRTLTDAGDVVVDLSEPCLFLNEETHLCNVYDNRFHKYAHCGRVNLFRALFNPTLPPSCAYAKTFRGT